MAFLICQDPFAALELRDRQSVFRSRDEWEQQYKLFWRRAQAPEMLLFGMSAPLLKSDCALRLAVLPTVVNIAAPSQTLG
ncbi:hypothetical protein SAMN05216534_0124 [Candidatus Aquiluna sp. UB-MaderosW2red]|nr:hypothetical protein SAMN05216534_0124 [Candidatus Aquiluna sp. UB-MaderosW2red]